MSIKYDLYQSVNTQDKNYTHYHARPVSNSLCTKEELYRHMSHHIKFKPEEIEAVMNTLDDVLVELLSEGKTVQMGTIGNVQVTLGVEGKVRDPKDLRADSVSVAGVAFRPRKRLLTKIQSKSDFERVRYKNHSQEYTYDQLKEEVVAYLQEHGKMKRSDLQEHFGLTQSTAVNRLSRLKKEGVIENESGDPKHPLYVLKKEEN